MPIDRDKAIRELPILRDFIDFVNRQVGVYCDCLSGFNGNKVRIERQVARVLHPVSQQNKNGRPVTVYASVEDPTRPDIIHQRIIRATEFIDENSEANLNEQQICWVITVFIFSYWEETIRKKLAKIRDVEPDDIKVNALGDLRLIRNSIVHNDGIITNSKYKRLKILSSICKPNTKVALTHDQLHTVFVEIKKAISELMVHYTGHLPGAPKPGEIVDVAIQNAPRERTPRSEK